jgi:hypothetical protein
MTRSFVILLTKHHSGDIIKKAEMGGHVGSMGGRSCCRVVMGK